MREVVVACRCVAVVLCLAVMLTAAVVTAAPGVSMAGVWRVVPSVSCVADGRYLVAPDLVPALAVRLAAGLRSTSRVRVVQAGKSLWWVQEDGLVLEGRLSGARLVFETSKDVLDLGAFRIAVSSRMQGRLDDAGQAVMEKDVDLRVTGAERVGAFGVTCRFHFVKMAPDEKVPRGQKESK